MDPPSDDINSEATTSVLIPPPQPERIRFHGLLNPASSLSFISPDPLPTSTTKQTTSGDDTNSSNHPKVNPIPLPTPAYSKEELKKLKKIKTEELNLKRIIDENEKRFDNSGENVNVGRRIIVSPPERKRVKPQGPQMPHVNVLDLAVFPSMSKRHSHLARSLHGN